MGGENCMVGSMCLKGDGMEIWILWVQRVHWRNGRGRSLGCFFYFLHCYRFLPGPDAERTAARLSSSRDGALPPHLCSELSPWIPPSLPPPPFPLSFTERGSPSPPTTLQQHAAAFRFTGVREAEPIHHRLNWLLLVLSSQW